MTILLQSLLATFFVSAVSLVSIVIVYSMWSQRMEIFTLSLAAGVLLATTFLELLPAAMRTARDGNIFIAALAAMMAFFLLERFLHGFHEHEESHVNPSRYLVLVGDGLHNFIDGVAIAASFAVSPTLGVATTLAVATHEIPKEIGDFGILVAGGFSRRTALLLNFLSGLAAALGAIVCFAFQSAVQQYLAWFMTATAGMFLYIAASDLIPELHRGEYRRSWLVTAPLLAGVAFVAILNACLPG